MPKTATHQTNPHQPCQIAIRIPGHLKNQIVDHCQQHQTSITQWLTHLIQEALLTDKGLIPRPADHPLPNVADVISGYLQGERVLGPCGRLWGECEAAGVVGVNGVGFCGCGVRVV
jgi:hypothetical protein